jgi:predicted membrane protein
VASAAARLQLSRIRQVRRGLIICAALLAAWLIIEFVTYAGRIRGFDIFDFLFPLIAIAIGWLLYEGWRAQCPNCGSPFFRNSGLPLGFHFSSRCPYCGAQLEDIGEADSYRTR